MRDGGTVSLDLKDLKVISALGRGAKGVVFLVQTAEGNLLALKAISRSSIEEKRKLAKGGNNGNEYRRVLFERDVLASFDHPLLPKLQGVVRTDKIVGYAIDYCSGGDLNYLRRKQTEKMFSDDIIRFYAAELVLALEYLHSQGIVYRDLKPENVMVQENGHLMLVDFDLSGKLAPKSPETRSTASDSKPEIKAKKEKKKLIPFLNRRRRRRQTEVSPDDAVRLGGFDSPSSSESYSVEKSNSFVGTEEYVAPEMILGSGHDFSVDWWCFGVMLYEMLYGKTPFRGETRKDTFSRVISRPPNLTGDRTPLRDLIGKLLEKDPRKRISVRDIKGHEFFRGVDWDTITEMPRPPFIPELTDADAVEEEGIDIERYVQCVFNGDAAEDGGSFDDNKSKKHEAGNVKKEVWVNNNHPTQIQNENFLVF